jgi:hypothetical protein
MNAEHPSNITILFNKIPAKPGLAADWQPGLP